MSEHLNQVSTSNIPQQQLTNGLKEEKSKPVTEARNVWQLQFPSRHSSLTAEYRWSVQSAGFSSGEL